MEDLISAFRACLNPDHQTPPTSHQKRLVMAALDDFCWANQTTYSAIPTDFPYRSGMQAVRIFIRDHALGDVSRDQQTTAEGGRSPKPYPQKL